MRVADAEAAATMDGDTPSASGNGAGAGAAENGAAAAGAARGGKKREFGTEYVDECSATRIKDAGKAEERNKKDAALLQRYEARVKEVCGVLRAVRLEVSCSGRVSITLQYE